jgi:hypothetical protein
MYQLPEIERLRCIAAIDAKQYQKKPLLAESVYKRAGLHEIMIETNGELCGFFVSYVVVKCLDGWSLYFSYGKFPAKFSSLNGDKASVSQVKQLIEVEGDLLELYRI